MIYTVPEVASILGCSTEKVIDFIRADLLETFTFPSWIEHKIAPRVTRSELQAFMINFGFARRLR